MIRWEVDDRAPTLWTRAYVRGMWWRRDKEAFEGTQHTLEVARDKQASGDRPPTHWTRLARRVVTRDDAGLRAWVVSPRRRRPRIRVVYLHGGGYVHPLTVDYWRLVRALTHAPAEVVVPAYPLAPDATVDDVLPRLLDLVRTQSAGPDALPTVLMGDSAGGALVLTLARRLRDDDVDLRGVVMLSPWLDATLDEARVADLEATDPMLAESGLRAAGRWWAGLHRRPEDPLVSPVNEPLQDLPPLDLFIGERDILRPAVDRLAKRAEQDGAELRIHETPAMFHVWMTRAIPEARRTRSRLVRLLEERVSREPA